MQNFMNHGQPNFTSGGQLVPFQQGAQQQQPQQQQQPSAQSQVQTNNTNNVSFLMNLF